MDRRKQRTGKVRPILRETHPSYYAFILDGETMLGEYWESNPRSHCHDMMGHIIEWYYNGIAGIIPEAPGFAKITIRPHLPESMHELEYKNPDDALTIDDYYKTVGYACLYKGLGESVDQIPADELTISIFRESCPREMFKTMKKMGLEIEERYPGIYYISGKQALFDTQIVVTKQLEKETHRTLRVLSKHVQEEDVRAFVEKAGKMTEPGDRNNIDAVLHVSVSANREIYEAIRRCDKIMCDALRELMKEDFEETKQETKQETLLETIKNLMDTMKWTAEQAMTAMKIPDADRGKYIAKL